MIALYGQYNLTACLKVDGTARPSMTASLLEMHEAKGGDEAEAVAIMDVAAMTYVCKSRKSSIPRELSYFKLSLFSRNGRGSSSYISSLLSSCSFQVVSRQQHHSTSRFSHSFYTLKCSSVCKPRSTMWSVVSVCQILKTRSHTSMPYAKRPRVGGLPDL